MYDIPAQNTTPATQFDYIIHHQAMAEGVKYLAFIYMDELHGWCSNKKAGILIDLVLAIKPETIVEIGVFGGKSVIPMACALKANQKGIIYGIDPWDKAESLQWMEGEAHRDWWSKIDHKAIMDGLIQKISLFNLEDQIVLIQNTSAGADPIQNIDILHIDGNHSEASSYFDVTKWVPLVRKGGWIVFDDVAWNENGVTTTARAVDWLNSNCIKVAEFQDTSPWAIWQK